MKKKEYVKIAEHKLRNEPDDPMVIRVKEMFPFGPESLQICAIATDMMLTRIESLSAGSEK